MHRIHYRLCSTVMPLPPLVVLLVGKKLGAFGLYQIAKIYGIKTMYKNLLRVNQKITPSHRQDTIRDALHKSFQMPSQAYDALKGHEMHEFVQGYVKETTKYMPAIVTSFAKSMLDRNKFLKVVSDMEKEAVKRKGRTQPPPSLPKQSKDK